MNWQKRRHDDHMNSAGSTVVPADESSAFLGPCLDLSPDARRDGNKNLDNEQKTQY